MSQTAEIHHGISSWVDYDGFGNSRTIWTMSLGSAFIWANFVAVALTLATPRLFIIIHFLIIWVWKSVSSPTPKAEESSENRALLNDDESGGDTEDRPKIDKSTPREVFTPIQPVQDLSGTLGMAAVHRIFYPKLHYPKTRNWRHIFGLFLLSILCMAFFVATTIFAIWSSTIANDSVVLSSSKNCGIWGITKNLNVLSPFYYLQEKESGDYAKKCYSSTPDGDSPEADECNYFYTQSLRWYETPDNHCPFAPGFCNGTSYTMTTGLVDARALGINVEIPYTFKRTTTCAPIQREGYHEISDNFIYIDYNYGPQSGYSPGNVTWVGLNMVWPAQGYAANTFCGHSESEGWHPIPEFRADEPGTVTLILVNSQGNLHMEESFDPIFPARTHIPLGQHTYYFNADPIATALACRDFTEICDPTGVYCWSASNNASIEVGGQQGRIGYYMLQKALSGSRICDAIQLRGGTALDATTKLNTLISMPLDKEQWKIEARDLFTTSLARIQINLRDYMRGSGAREPGFSDETAEGMRDMCGMYKFNGTGWLNMRKSQFLGLLAVSTAIALLSYSALWTFLFWLEKKAKSLWKLVGQKASAPEAPVISRPGEAENRDIESPEGEGEILESSRTGDEISDAGAFEVGTTGFNTPESRSEVAFES